MPVKTAYFAYLSGYYDFVSRPNVVVTEMIRLNPDLRFMPAEIFSRCEVIPLKILANRKVAVLVSDNKYQTLGEVGEQSRRQSFYHSNTPRHPELSDERIAELAKLGFFLVPGDYVNGEFSRERHPVFNINGIDDFSVRSHCFDLLISDEQLPEYEYPQYKHLVGDLLQYPIIETGQVSQAAYVSSVYSPTNKNHLFLIRPADTKLPMLQGTELIETKYQAMIDRAVNAGQPTSIKNEGVLNKSLREAKFFMAPYQESIRFCQSVIETLNAYPQEYPDLSVAINKAISRLAFSEQYMTDCAGLVRQAIVYDELMQLENTSTMEELKIKQKEISQQFIQKEVEWHKKAVQEEILSGQDSYFPMINLHSLIVTSLGDLLMAMGYRNSPGENALRDKIVDLKAEAENICTQTDELLSDRKTIHSLKLKSIWVSIESTDAEDDVENP
ncbi:hypothetical protein [Endozoicomonas acroporae]|uniref:hypothetical protein n=1 Tax=Endozoicomonas acroporae TaxID=1701104 RepID=UPI0019D4FCAA|nr:hypothetical protein [Endozoicomonas acroporae]